MFWYWKYIFVTGIFYSVARSTSLAHANLLVGNDASDASFLRLQGRCPFLAAVSSFAPLAFETRAEHCRKWKRLYCRKMCFSCHYESFFGQHSFLPLVSFGNLQGLLLELGRPLGGPRRYHRPHSRSLGVRTLWRH